MIFKLAWRNIWRNKGRTFITLALVAFAVVLATLMATLRSGIMDLQVDNALGGFEGYASVSDTAYFSKPNMDDLIEFDDSLKNQLDNNKKVKAYAPRIMGGGLVHSHNKSKPGAIIAIDPKLENNLTNISSRLVKGRMMEGPGEIVLGSRFAKRLKVDLDSVIFVNGMGYHGNSANMMLKVVGMVKLTNIQQDKRVGFISLDEGFYSFATEGKVSEVVLSFDNNSRALKRAEKLKGSFGETSEVYSWKERNESLFMMVQMNDAANVIISAMLYFIISFGLFGTILMMLSERKREFGMLVSIGMKKRKLAFLVFLENIFVSTLGTIIGLFPAIAVAYSLNKFPIKLTGQDAKNMEEFGFEPLLKTSIDPQIFMWQAIAVLSIAVLFSIYPLFKITTMNENKALRS